MSQKKDKGKILFFRESVFKVAELIFNNPNKTFHIRMLEKETGFSTTAVIDVIEELKKYEIITIEETPLTTNVRANLESEVYRFYKLVFNLYRLKRYLFVDNLIDIFNNPEAIVLFGSFAKGEDIEESDIDILVISSQKNNENLEDFVNLFERELNRKINIHILHSLAKSSNEFKNAVANGIVLHGYLKII
ncbi:nucleotidyltransferase domain-containing protein [Candidatus Woesearchaeota archaeon]|nr:nucleotidyltransferase domain-containing protein [Candidatus Woesearchaeota archaeon]